MSAFINRLSIIIILLRNLKKFPSVTMFQSTNLTATFDMSLSEFFDDNLFVLNDLEA